MTRFFSSGVGVVSSLERDRALSALVLAFANDPMVRWSLPEAQTYLACFPDVASAFAGNAFEAGTVHCAADFSAVAIWHAPASEPDHEALGAVLQQVMLASRFAEAGEVMGQMEAFHPKEPHWYLPLIGVDPAKQGMGFGSQLMQHALAECDDAGLPAYLESSNPANIPFYERHGFVVMGEIQAGTSPVMYPMLRKPF